MKQNQSTPWNNLKVTNQKQLNILDELFSSFFVCSTVLEDVTDLTIINDGIAEVDYLQVPVCYYDLPLNIDLFNNGIFTMMRINGSKDYHIGTKQIGKAVAINKLLGEQPKSSWTPAHHALHTTKFIALPILGTFVTIREDTLDTDEGTFFNSTGEGFKIILPPLQIEIPRINGVFDRIANAY